MKNDVYLFLLQALPYITRRKTVPRELFKELETTTYKLLILSLLFGMVHVKEKEEQKLFFDPVFDATFEEAVEFMKEKLSLPPEEFYKLDAKARFRAFTVAKLTGLDAIERVKEKLAKAIEEGKTLKEWIEELGEDGILRAVGFHQSNPWYLETVFRTNISTAYNAGRLMQFARTKDKIKYLEYVAIDDSRTTPICRRLDGTKLPPDDPFWATYTPPLHFNCRSTVRAIFKGSNEAKKVRKRKPKDIPPIPEGFTASPLDSWWKLTDSMAKRVVKYGLKEEVLEKAKKMCGKNFEDGDCPEFKEMKKKLGKLEELKRQLAEANRKLLERSKLVKTESRQKFLNSFALLWKKKRRFWEHVQTRIDRGHLPDIGNEETAFLYARQIVKVLATHSKIVVERGRTYRQQTFLQSGSWVVVINDKGRIETAFPVTIGLKRWLESHKLIDETLEIADYEADKEIRETFERILRRIEKL